MSYLTHEIASAADIREGTLQQWLKRGHIRVFAEGDHFGGGKGNTRRLSWKRAINIGIAAELSRIGVSPAVGSDLALKFSDLGDEARQPGGLFPTGRTLFIVRRVDGEFDATVDNSPDVTSLFLDRRRRFASSIIVIDMNALVARMRSRLNPPNEAAD